MFRAHQARNCERKRQRTDRRGGEHGARAGHTLYCNSTVSYTLLPINASFPLRIYRTCVDRDHRLLYSIESTWCSVPPLCSHDFSLGRPGSSSPAPSGHALRFLKPLKPGKCWLPLVALSGLLGMVLSSSRQALTLINCRTMCFSQRMPPVLSRTCCGSPGGGQICIHCITWKAVTKAPTCGSLKTVGYMESVSCFSDNISCSGADWTQISELRGDFFAQNYDAIQPGPVAPW